MGAGIAQLAAAAGARTLLHDPVPEARERGLAADRRRPRALAGQGPPGARARRGRRRRPSSTRWPTAGLVIEAAPERLELKRELFAALSAVAPERRAGLQHLLDPDHRDRQRGGRPRARGRHALLQPRADHGPRRGHRGHRLLAARRSTSRAPPGGRWASTSSTPPTGPASWSTAATGPSASRRSSSCRSAWPTSRPSTRSRAPRAFAWGPSSCRTSSGSTSATRSRSPSTSSASASRAGGPRR